MDVWPENQTIMLRQFDSTPRHHFFFLVTFFRSASRFPASEIPVPFFRSSYFQVLVEHLDEAERILNYEPDDVHLYET